ncbi:MAG: hypothetical protein V4613_02090 [Bacteroidota bacterium]
MRFSEIYGHADLKQKLVAAARQGRIPHAQMFTGGEGNFSLAMALAYAQFLSCTQQTETDSCGECSSCRKYNAMIHPDLHFTFPFYGDKTTNSSDFMTEFRAAVTGNHLLGINDWIEAIGGEGKNLNININEVRGIFRKLSLRPYESEYKVLLMWLPEYLGKEGNTLLKLIEEPPDKTIFLLVTENLQAILPTIISRTQIVKIPVFSHAEIEQYLKESGLSTDTNLIKNIAMMSEGNLNKAVKLLSDVESPMFEIFRQWMLECHKGQMENILALTEKITDQGKDFFKLFLNYGLHIIRATLTADYKSSNSYLSDQEIEFVGKLKKYITVGNVEELYNAFNSGIFEIERYGNVKLIYINLSLKLKNNLKLSQQKVLN